MNMTMRNVIEWTCTDVKIWLIKNGYEEYADLFYFHEIDGKVLLTLKEEDLKSNILSIKKIGAIKKLYLTIKQLQRDNVAALFDLGYMDLSPSPNFYTPQKHEVSRNFFLMLFWQRSKRNTTFEIILL